MIKFFELFCKKKGGKMSGERYKPGDVLTVQVRVKEVIETEEGVKYLVTPRDNEYFALLRVPEEDVINRVET